MNVGKVYREVIRLINEGTVEEVKKYLNSVQEASYFEALEDEFAREYLGENR